MARWHRSDWLIPLGLILLSLIPVIAGITRLAMLAKAVPVTPDNARFFANPLPVVLHIVSVAIYCLVGAFQFSPGLRRNHVRWHRYAGRVLVPCGLVAALSGLWMALTYAIVPADNALLHAFRLLAGTGMAGSIVLGYAAIRRWQVEIHQAWMRRAYAIGQGAGTQALIMIVPTAVLGVLDDMTRALLMGAAWLINLCVAEWLIQRRRRARALPAAV